VSAGLVSPGLRGRVRRMAEPIAAGFGRVGLTPNHLTVIGLAIACVAAAVAATGAWLPAGLLVFFGAVFDLFDGALARATGTASRYGAFLDSVLDRTGEAVVYVGIAWGLLGTDWASGAVASAAALGAASLVSYTRAKSESLGFTPGNGMASVGLAPREVRVVLLTLGLLGAGLLPAPHPIVCIMAPCPQPADPRLLSLVGSLVIIAVLATVTSLQRILHVRAQAKEG
jgi:CDP-diacylglycerol--glycerol-3-phosphate 3-phosphatidyltransferase